MHQVIVRNIQSGDQSDVQSGVQSGDQRGGQSGEQSDEQTSKQSEVYLVFMQSICINSCPSHQKGSLVKYSCQMITLPIVIIASVVNLSLYWDEKGIWLPLLCSSLGYIYCQILV